MVVARPVAFAARSMATVEGSTSRQMPQPTARATPVSRERALFTIKVLLPSYQQILVEC